MAIKISPKGTTVSQTGQWTKKIPYSTGERDWRAKPAGSEQGDTMRGGMPPRLADESHARRDQCGWDAMRGGMPPSLADESHAERDAMRGGMPCGWDAMRGGMPPRLADG